MAEVTVPRGLFERVLFAIAASVRSPGPMLRTSITFGSTDYSQDTCVPMKVGGSDCPATRPLPRGPKGSDGIPADWTVEVPTH
jgi:hypothetical protein